MQTTAAPTTTSGSGSGNSTSSSTTRKSTTISHIPGPKRFGDIYALFRTLTAHFPRSKRLGHSEHGFDDSLRMIDGKIECDESAKLVHAVMWALSALKERAPRDLNENKFCAIIWQATVHIIASLRPENLSTLMEIWLVGMLYKQIFDPPENGNILDMNVPLAHLFTLVERHRMHLLREIDVAIEKQDEGNESDESDENEDDIIDRKKFFVLEEFLFILRHIPFTFFATDFEGRRPILDTVLGFYISLTQLLDSNQEWVIALDPNRERSKLYEELSLLIFDQSFIKNDKNMKKPLLEKLKSSSLFDHVLISQFASIIQDEMVNTKPIEFLESLFISRMMEHVVTATTKLNSFLNNMNAGLQDIITSVLNTDKNLYGTTILQGSDQLLRFMIRLGGMKRIQKHAEFLGCILTVFCIVFSESIDDVEDITSSNEMFTMACDFYRWLANNHKDKPTFYVIANHWKQFNVSREPRLFFKRIHSHLETLQEMPKNVTTILQRQDIVNFEKIMQVLDEKHPSITFDSSDEEESDEEVEVDATQKDQKRKRKMMSDHPDRKRRIMTPPNDREMKDEKAMHKIRHVVPLKHRKHFLNKVHASNGSKPMEGRVPLLTQMQKNEIPLLTKRTHDTSIENESMRNQKAVDGRNESFTNFKTLSRLTSKPHTESVTEKHGAHLIHTDPNDAKSKDGNAGNDPKSSDSNATTENSIVT